MSAGGLQLQEDIQLESRNGEQQCPLQREASQLGQILKTELSKHVKLHTCINMVKLHSLAKSATLVLH